MAITREELMNHPVVAKAATFLPEDALPKWIENTLNCKDMTISWLDVSLEEESLVSFLAGSFIWDETPENEGPDYWGDIAFGDNQ